MYHQNRQNVGTYTSPIDPLGIHMYICDDIYDIYIYLSYIYIYPFQNPPANSLGFGDLSFFVFASGGV